MRFFLPAVLLCVVWELSAKADALVFEDDFSAQRPGWTLAIDGGYVGQPTLQGPLTQAMIDEALAGSYSNISAGTLNLKANTTSGRDWGAASASLDFELPENFRVTFSSNKSQWAGHQRFKFFESDPTSPFLYNSVAPANPKHGRSVQFTVSGNMSSDLLFEPIEDQPTFLDAPENGGHTFGYTYQYEIEKVANRFTVWRDGALQYEYSGGLELDFLNYLGIVNLQAGATSSVDDLQIYSIPVPPAPNFLLSDPSGNSGAHSVNLAYGDGSGISAVAGSLRDPRGISINAQSGEVYWAEPGAMRIAKAPINGSGPVQSIASADNGVADVAIDPNGGKIYWTDSNNNQINAGQRTGRVRRANLDGSQIEDVANSNLRHPVAIAIDTTGNKLYWTDLEGNLDGAGSIQRANLDGSSRETVLTGIDEANGLAIDSLNGKLYWTELATGKVQRSNLDGSNFEDVIIGLTTPSGIDVDNTMGFVYWNAYSPALQTSQIQRAKLDGSNQEVVLSGIGAPFDIVLLPIPEPSSAIMLSVGSLILLSQAFNRANRSS